MDISTDGWKQILNNGLKRKFVFKMTNKIWIYLILIAVGLFVLAWPEQDNLMLIKISETHGPSRLDTAGIVILLAGYVPMVIQVIKRLNSINNTIGKPKSVALMLISLFFLVMIAIALYFSIEPLLWVSVAISTISQVILIYYAFQVAAKSEG
jgi:hypothetical protein